MAFELPVVATTAGALPEVVLPDITGLLVPPDSAEALAAAILRLLGDRPLRQRLGRAGRERVQSEYLVDGLAARMLNVYAAAAGKR
jgi:glycosyltransferase involved in cell wall biosynthesis